MVDWNGFAVKQTLYRAFLKDVEGVETDPNANIYLGTDHHYGVTFYWNESGRHSTVGVDPEELVSYIIDNMQEMLY